MSFKRMMQLVIFSAISFMTCPQALASVSSASIETEYVLGAGSVSDGEYIWTIPYEENSFSKINIHTGEKENLKNSPNFTELNGLSGYRCGTLYETTKGERFLYLAPFDVSKPLARINLSDLSIDYPIRSVGYYFGSCHIVSENGIDYLWLFPSKIKPHGVSSETEIVKLNLTENRKELAIPTKINDKYVSFSDTVKVDQDIWLLPEEQGQPLIRMNTMTTKEMLDSEGNKIIYTNEKMNFSKITTGVTDGASVLFVLEDISFLFNDCVLARCDKDGNLIEKIPLSMDKYTKAVSFDEFIYLFSGAEGMYPKCVKINLEGGTKEEFQMSDKKGYVVAEAINANAGIYVLPFTKDAKKMPVIKVIESPKTEIRANSDDKLYRDFGDKSVGCGLMLNFNATDGFMADNVRWMASGKEFDGKDSHEIFMSEFDDKPTSEKSSAKINGYDEMTVLADKNGYYRFMTEFISDDGETYLYSFCDYYVENIFERLPITITRYNIEKWDEESIIERITREKDFGAAFSFDGNEFLRSDAPMDLVPSKSVFADGYYWKAEEPFRHTISLVDGSIEPDNYFADVDVFYRIVKTEPLIEDEE